MQLVPPAEQRLVRATFLWCCVLLGGVVGCTHSHEPSYLPAAEIETNPALKHGDAWFDTPQATHLCDNIVSWQNANGGWWKRYDPTRPRPAILPPPNPHDAPPADDEIVWRGASTFDNGATYSEMRLLAHAYRVTGRSEWRRSFENGLEFVLASQYGNGGWPQRFPLQDNYSRHITFNDNAMTGVMLLLQDIAAGRQDFAFLSAAQRERSRVAFGRGIACILACQQKSGDTLTVWCQQHDEVTLAPAPGRAYEPPALTAGESCNVLLLLMSLPSPSEQVHRSITAAMAWYDATAIEGKRYIMVTGPQYPNGKDHLAIEDPSAPPIWARLYDVKTSRPIFSDRDGRVYDSLGSISYERRLNYHWYGYWGWTVQQAFAKWSKQIGGGQQSSTSIRP